MPGFLLKLSSPYWFDKVNYLNRIRIGSLLMALSFTFVGTFNHFKAGESGNAEEEGNGLNFNVYMQLLGVAFCSAQGDLGEATLLALSGRADSLMNETCYGNSNDMEGRSVEETKSLSITAFASGTGLAGPLGFGFVVVLTDVLGFSLTQSMYLSLVFPICYLQIFRKYLIVFTHDTLHSVEDNNEESAGVYDSLLTNDVDANLQELEEDTIMEDTLSEHDASTRNTTLESSFQFNDAQRIESFEVSDDDSTESCNLSNGNAISKKSAWERLKLTMSLWIFMVPLFVVYAAEYALQSGVWTAIGFPVDDEEARRSFYTNSNWAYQIGVFVSRSSGAFCMAPMWVLWLMPLLQCCNLVFFYFVALKHFWYNNFLLIPSFYVGLLGGSVYVNGYMRINKDLPFDTREFALSTVSVADSLGIMIADFSGLFIQSCLYKVNNINGAVVSCPI